MDWVFEAKVFQWLWLPEFHVHDLESHLRVRYVVGVDFTDSTADSNRKRADSV